MSNALEQRQIVSLELEQMSGDNNQHQLIDG
jgi:hypothetical protein